MRVLIADDEKVSRKLLRLTLAAEGHQVTEAGNGVEALSALRSAQFDAVISDILMPEMDGYRLCHEIRQDEVLREIPVVIYSATYTSAAEEDVALGMGANRFLRKPAPAAAILAALEEATRHPAARRDLRPATEGVDILRQYSERLVQKLEQRNLQLEAAKEDIARANEELQRSAAQVRLLLDSTAEGIYGLDLEGRFTFVNFACVSMLGYKSPDDLLGKVAHDLIHHSRLDGTPCPMEECVIYRALRDGREARSDSEVLWRADGTSLTAAHWSHPVVQGGRSVGSVVTFIDVTERELAQRQMRQSDERFRRLFESNTIGIVIADLSGTTVEANDVYLHMLGYTRQELVEGKIRWDDITPPEYRDRDRLAVEELRRTGVSPPWEKELLRKDGSRVPVLLGVAMLEASEGSCIAYIVDLSKSRHLEDQLRQAQKIEAIGQLAGGIAHDFNNLLTAILGYSEMLEGQLADNAPLLSEVREIQKAGDRAASLTRQLLAFSRLQVLEPTVLDLNEIVRNFEKMWTRLISEDIDLVTALHPELGLVRADAGQLEQVIMNLVVNSRDAMPSGGKLTIETANVELDEAYARQHVSVRPGNYVMFAVSDTGVGMDATTQARIFEPFFTTKEMGKGTGLGLSTAYGIVKQSGGYVWVYSEPGKGSTFKVYLPRVEGVPAAAYPARPAAPPRGDETILLVEDEELVRKLAHTLLEGLGYTVLEAPGGEHALEIARTHPGPIHLVLTDVVMPGMGGADLASRLHAARPGLRVLYMSGYTDDAIVRHKVLEPGTSFLQKPFTPAVLARKVREALS
jgi:PAS domain S-box-containing protein